MGTHGCEAPVKGLGFQTETLPIGLILLTLFDIPVMVLIWHEYGLVRRHQSTR
jgi:uncharacterized membrane protein